MTYKTMAETTAKNSIKKRKRDAKFKQSEY